MSGAVRDSRRRAHIPEPHDRVAELLAVPIVGLIAAGAFAQQAGPTTAPPAATSQEAKQAPKKPGGAKAKKSKSDAKPRAERARKG
ncbi:hypothetical protein [Variovorax sp. GB1P17]|uniref:hypothetical protein n=1 Tax=Variovorax sp. GB1P17 TaxID=3443740 RepID=UPI003F48DC3A